MTTRSRDHTARFIGEAPCDASGNPLSRVINSTISEQLSDGVVMSFRFSQKPARGYYDDHYEQVATYVALLGVPHRRSTLARRRRPSPWSRPPRPARCSNTRTRLPAVPESWPPAPSWSATRSRSSVWAAPAPTSSTPLAKTPVQQIHLYDDDDFLQHNGFRAPGAASIEDLRAKKKKVAYYRGMYSKMRNGSSPTPTASTRAPSRSFGAWTSSSSPSTTARSRGLIAQALTDGASPSSTSAWASGRTTVPRRPAACLDQHPRTSIKNDTLPTGAPTPGNDYERNIQVADLNALSAVLAVIKWKKLVGFYLDLEGEHYARYTVDGNHLINEDLGMSLVARVAHEFVEFIPDKLAPYTVYVSMEYGTAAHACLCGCGHRVITPITPTDWHLTFDGDTISLHPSIGNWNFPCRSHYIINQSRVIWAEQWTREQIDGGTPPGTHGNARSATTAAPVSLTVESRHPRPG